MMNMITHGFKVVGEESKNGIRIYGLDEDNREKFGYKMKFNNRGRYFMPFFHIKPQSQLNLLNFNEMKECCLL